MASLKVKTGPPHLCNTQAAQIDIVGETQNFLPTLLLLAFLHPPQYIKKPRTFTNALFYKEMQRGGE